MHSHCAHNTLSSMQIIGCDYLHLFELQFPSNSHMNLQLKKGKKKKQTNSGEKRNEMHSKILK